VVISGTLHRTTRVVYFPNAGSRDKRSEAIPRDEEEQPRTNNLKLTDLNNRPSDGVIIFATVDETLPPLDNELTPTDHANTRAHVYGRLVRVDETNIFVLASRASCEARNKRVHRPFISIEFGRGYQEPSGINATRTRPVRSVGRKKKK